jgi:hypothetical protein
MKTSVAAVGVVVPNVFISYSRRDRERVIQLADALQSEGLSVWWDPNLVPGRKFRQMIAEQLAAADCVVVVWTAASLESDWVQDEAEEARVRGVLIPVMMDPVKAPAGFRQVQAADLSQWSGNPQHPEFRALVQAAKTLAQMARDAAPASSPLPGEITAAPDVSLRPGDTPTARREAPAAAAPKPETIERPLAPKPSRIAPVASNGAATALKDGAFVRLGERLFDLAAKPKAWLALTALVLATPVYFIVTHDEHVPLLAWALCLTPCLGGVLAMAGQRRGLGSAAKTTVVALAGACAVIGLLAAWRMSHSGPGLLRAMIYFSPIAFAGVLSIGVLVALAITASRRKPSAALP